MPATLKTRKPVVRLTATDLRTFPVWEYAIDEEGDGEQDETWVRPVDCAAIRKGKYSQIVGSDFRTSAGRKLQGFMDVTTARGQVEIAPGGVVGSICYRVLPAVSRKLAAARKYEWSLGERDRLCQSLGVPEVDVFPLRYLLRVPIRGEASAREGVIR
jgi:hypothetical protein